MTKDERKDTIEACKDLMDDYNKHCPNEEDKGMMDVLGQEEDEVEEEEKKESEDPNRRQDITLDDLEDESD